MRELNIDLKGAMDWAANYHATVEDKFINGLHRLPSFSREVDAQLQEYILGLANWPRSNDCWNFESGRYFGDKGLEIQKTRRVRLLPKVHKDANRRTTEVEVTLVEL
jgi:Delta6-protoilludene synthase